MKKRILIAAAVSVVLITAVIAIIAYIYLPNNNVEPAFDEGKLNLVVEGEVVEWKNPPKVEDEEILLPLDLIKKYFDPNICWDDSLKKVTVTTKDKVVRMKTQNLQAMINNKPVTLKIPVTLDKDVVYVPIEFLSDFYNIDIAYLRDKNVIMIDNRNNIKQIAEPVSGNAVIRRGRSIKYPIIKKLDINSKKHEEIELRVFEEYDNWYKVRTWDGAVGYIEKRFIAVKKLIADNIPEQETKSNAWKPEGGKINAAWDMMYEKRTGVYKEEKIAGIDVIMPTWFQVKDDKGELINRADAKYIEWAHKKGYKVWALLSNDSGNTSMTHRFLSNTDSRDSLIRKILVYASLYKLDGINIDFENINLSDKDALSQFVRELTPFCREQGLVVSMDVTPMDGSANWSLCFDRKEIGRVVDYVMLMAYDQNWPNFGPNAQLPWVEKSLQKVLDLVPKEKLILGIPTYTRVWKEGKDRSGKQGNIYDKAMSIENARKALIDNKATVTWDEKGSQFYGEYQKSGIMYKLWLEDSNSIDFKASLIHKYKLAGAAVWSKNYGENMTWNVLNNVLKATGSYQEWKENSKNKMYQFK